MQKNVIITGKPKSGKSTLLRQLIADLPDKVGFVTNEILEAGNRVGFELETNQGHRAILAHVDFQTPHPVSKYAVDVANLDAIIPEVAVFESGDFLYLDEIGQMELFSDKFKELALQYFDAPNTCLATLSAVYDDDFTKAVRARDDVILVELTPAKREKTADFMAQLIKKIAKAKAYLAEPQRFFYRKDGIVLQSEHGTRVLELEDGNWCCSCDFYKEHQLCSHLIAAREYIKHEKASTSQD